MIKAISLISMVFLVFNVNINAFMIANETNGAYSPPPPDGVASINSITLRQLIADGGSHFLKSAGHINQFFSLVESSEITGPDYKALNKTLNVSIYYMEQTRITYLQLKNLASATPYNQEVIYKLLNFNHDSFQAKNGLFTVIFEKAKGFRVMGNVTGVYNELHAYTGHILDLLYTLKKDVDYEIFPDISTVWKVNQKYSEAKLFGQYVAQIFYFIK